MSELSILGLAHHRYRPPVPFGITQADRLLHLYLIGQTGTGKSTLLLNLARQDAARGVGFCLIDPHGDLAEALHREITEPHLYWGVADPACSLGYNPLARVSAAHRPLVASGLIETLKKQWPDAWGARMEHLLRYAVLALLEQPSADLRDIMKLFVFKGFRRQVTERLTDPQVRAFWKHEFPTLNYQTSADGVSPIANKLGAFLAHPTVRTALCGPASPLRFRHLMSQNDLDVNVTKEKKLTNIRAAGRDENVVIVPARKLTIESALEFIDQDELVELTPDAIRVRKKILACNQRPKRRLEAIAAAEGA